MQRALRRHYDLPYALSRRKIESVLILGGGTGNDAAAALRNGATRVDVVEIDPVIARIGRTLHPEAPYASEHVTLYTDDARSFLQKTGRKYDLVVFGTLDSHAAFSSLSSIRMDNFVFTRESIRSARRRLNPGGGIAVNFFVIKPWLAQRHFNTLVDEVGAPVLAYDSPSHAEASLLAGSLFDPDRALGTTNFTRLQFPFATEAVEPTTDDWPFLFLERRGVPFHYVMPLLLILILALVPLRVSRVRAREVNWHLFFMGAAFLLIESKAVTTLAVIFGSTWLVNSIVIGSILTMILLANLIVGRFSHVGFPLLYAGLCAALIFNFLFVFDSLNPFGWTVRLLLAGAIVGAPLFLAALIFARAFAAVTSPSTALAANLLGSLVGGILEYADMWTGLRWLNVVALSLYGLSGVALLIQTRSWPRTTS
jgi:predicted membrane-bound spermidine synthase